MGYRDVMAAMPKRIPLPQDMKDIYGLKEKKIEPPAPRPFKTVFISQRAGHIWQEYCGIFKRRWGIDEDSCYNLGFYGKELASAEFKENGESAYNLSVMQPIRNAYYNSGRIDHRWETLGKLDIKEPVLDYGCGVGFLLLWMNRVGFKRLYGYELEGVTKRVMTEAFDAHGISTWAPHEHVETVLCINVLEHLSDPVSTLTYLKRIGTRVIANTCMDRHEGQHIAKESDLETCAGMLKEWGTYYES